MIGTRRRRRCLVLRDWKGLLFWLVLSCALAVVAHVIANDLGPMPPSYKAIAP